MYQFNQQLENLNSNLKSQDRRGMGLAVGLLSGWIPAWIINYFVEGGALGFLGFWILSTGLGYGVGRLLKKR